LRPINIHKAFAGDRASAGVAFDFRPGEIHALVGENGAGKSTLIKVMTGVRRPDRGEISLQGETLEISNP
jgi:ABC-type sugar transport system ATPase subunit